MGPLPRGAILVPLFITLGKLLNLLKPQFPYLQNRMMVCYED